ncbi:hypothetical protein [Nocardioides gilvus]|uniref:hypothetical protein n=1 Tax=Nocardioides gilvus TaxID=1735589 RepID=UPI001EF65711|nr:hypothetical protein [Nocardioides gilvus]
MDEVTWGALALTLTLAGGFYTWWAFTRRGLTPGMRGLALTLLPMAAWLTGTLQMFTQIANSVGRWATSLVFSPIVWLGTSAAGVSVALFLLARLIDSRRGVTPAAAGRGDKSVKSARGKKSLPPATGAGPAPVDDEFADIEAMLRKRGIQ